MATVGESGGAPLPQISKRAEPLSTPFSIAKRLGDIVATIFRTLQTTAEIGEPLKKVLTEAGIQESAKVEEILQSVSSKLASKSTATIQLDIEGKKSIRITKGGEVQLREKIGEGAFKHIYLVRSLFDSFKGIQVYAKRRKQLTPLQVERFASAMKQLEILVAEFPGVKRLALPHKVLHSRKGEKPRKGLCMAYFEGGDLSKKATVSVGLKCHLLADGARGLAELHDKGWTHNDFKPANILLTREGGEWRAKLGDLDGVAREGESTVTTESYSDPRMPMDIAAKGNDLFALATSILDLAAPSVVASFRLNLRRQPRRPLISF